MPSKGMLAPLKDTEVKNAKLSPDNEVAKLPDGSLKLHYRAVATDCGRAIALMAEFSDKEVF